MSIFVLQILLTNTGNNSIILQRLEVIYVKINNKSTQDWLNIELIDKNGVIKLKNKNIFIKILRIQPINFNLKTALEKEADQDVGGLPAGLRPDCGCSRGRRCGPVRPGPAGGVRVYLPGPALFGTGPDRPRRPVSQAGDPQYRV